MIELTQIDRRKLLKSLSTLALSTLLPSAVAETGSSPILAYLRSLERPDGGYAWPDDPESALPTTYASLACYRLLGEDPPAKAAMTQYVRIAYPQILRRLGDGDPHPMHQFDYEQVQCLLWLGQPIDDYKPRASKWVRPNFYPDQFEPNHVPVFQQEVHSILCRQLLGIAPTKEWESYILSRRRDNGSFNNTPAQDGSGGHVSNTLWGILAVQALGLAINNKEQLVEWVRSCQIENELFTYSPDATLAANDHVAYVWAAVRALQLLGTTVRKPKGARSYLASLCNEDGGFGDRPGRASNPIATMQALEALTILGPIEATQPRRTAMRPKGVPDNLNVYTIQIEAPGVGSPQAAVEMAKVLNVDFWGAKNSQIGWVAAAQTVARTEKVPVKFFVANEEYGTTIIIPGLGAYSHLADVTAPAGTDFGTAMNDPRIQPIPWSEFLSKRIDPLRHAGGSNVWQYNQNEALSRILLDQAVQSGTFSAISTFHFSDNFLETTPFLNRYRDVMPFIALQDAHVQTWWWMEHLVGFRTLFLAEAPTWEGWVKALKENWLVGVRHESRSGFRTEISGSTNGVRRKVLSQQEKWRWWDRMTSQNIRPLALFTIVRPQDIFDGGRPDSGVNLILRCWWTLEGSITPTREIVKLISLEVDGKRVEPQMIRVSPSTNGAGGDVYHLWHFESDQKGDHQATATVQMVETGALTTIVKTFSV